MATQPQTAEPPFVDLEAALQAAKDEVLAERPMTDEQIDAQRKFWTKSYPDYELDAILRRDAESLRGITSTVVVAQRREQMLGVARSLGAEDPPALVDAYLAHYAYRGRQDGNGRGAAEQDKPAAKPAAGFNLTDLGNAERLAHGHGDRVASVRGLGLMGYDPRRGVFVSDRPVLMRYAKQTVRRICAEAAACEDDKRRRELERHAHASESRRAIDAMLALAEAEEALEADANEFDADPELLNVTNGVVNLRDGSLHPHSPQYRMTKVAGAAYDPDAKCPVWLAHLRRITGDDAANILFLRRLYGYALTGLTAEQVFAIFYGSGANGKGITLNAFNACLGTYAQPTSVATFSPHRSDTIRNDLAALAGARLVTASETRVRQSLDEAMVKALTGDDPITARFLHREFFTFTPRFLIVLSTNQKPRVECADYAIKRRVLLVPFDITIPEAERDKHLGAKLRAEADGILTWGVQGAMDYLEHGLCIPDSVRAATETYRAEMDPLYGFMECCVFDEHSWTATSTIRSALERWAKEAGISSLPGQAELTTWLKDHGCVPQKQSHQRGWSGIACDGFDSLHSLESEAQA